MQIFEYIWLESHNVHEIYILGITDRKFTQIVSHLHGSITVHALGLSPLNVSGAADQSQKAEAFPLVCSFVTNYQGYENGLEVAAHTDTQTYRHRHTHARAHTE